MSVFPTRFHTSRVQPGSGRLKSGAVLNSVERDFSRSGTDTYKALLVDDNQDLLDLAAVLFRQLGFEVHTAASAEDALDLLAGSAKFDVLFTDVVMPGISGIQLGHEARRLNPDIKVILVSGYPQKAISAGHGTVHDFRFLNKPYRVDDIVRLLKDPN